MERSEVEAAPAFIVREYRDDDLQAVTRLWRESFPDDVERKEQHVTMIAKRAHREGLLLVADQGGAIIGSVIAGYDGHRGRLYAVAVDADHRRHAIGTALVRSVETRMAALGCVRINLQIGVEKAAIARFYHQLGYEVEERINMAKSLNG
mgnify:CR=1 FL=1|tara:strand:+ start:1732 stop:2181 length:450 start_codon:yes stop_codon:yes gene_type:complete